MELRGVEIVFMQGGTERHDIVGHGYGVRVDRHVIAVYEINEFVRAEAFEQRAACTCQRCSIPCGALCLRAFPDGTSGLPCRKCLTVRIAFFGMAAHQLLADADAQNGLLQVAYQTVQSPRTQVSHRTTGFSLSRKKHAVGFSTTALRRRSVPA